MNNKKTIEIIAPVFNEYEVIDEFINRLNKIINSDKSNRIKLTIVDDGSEAQFVDKLKKYQTQYKFKLIELGKNYGQQIAIRAGMDNSSADSIVFIDADLQDPPELINQMIDLWDKGSDVVHAIRTKREKESILKKITAKLFYSIVNQNSSYELTKNSGDFKLIDSEITRKIKKINDSELYIRGAVDYFATNPISISYDRNPRFAGKRKYKYKQSFNLALSGLASFSNFLSNFLVKSFGFFVIIFTIFVVYFLNALRVPDLLVKGWTSIVTILLFSIFLQIVSFLFIGVYLKKIVEQTSGKDFYFIKNIIE